MFDNIQIKAKRLLYRLRRDYLTLNNVVIVAALLIALNWTWSSIEVMQQNYQLQQLVDSKKQQVVLEELRVSTLELEGKYYNSLEYQELAVRERMGKGMPGEKAIIVPSTDGPTVTPTQKTTVTPKKSSNFQQWVNFLFGGRPNSLQK